MDIDLFNYEVQKLKFYDNFPFTKHVEAVALLTSENLPDVFQDVFDDEDGVRGSKL